MPRVLYNCPLRLNAVLKAAKAGFMRPAGQAPFQYTSENGAKMTVLYGSKYGPAGAYAQKPASILHASCFSCQDDVRLDQHDTVVYIGSLYAGGVLGLKKTEKNGFIPRKLITAAVGLADPSDSMNVHSTRTSLNNQIPSDVCDEALIFHLQ
ncbi:MAG: hypothetical protein HUJ54_05685 [Erysipelotrichaceae bacterium]|nr:hypothetical protein [Erysipelotrichaceae bacterium]